MRRKPVIKASQGARKNAALQLLLRDWHTFQRFVRSSVRDRYEAEEILQRTSLKIVSHASDLRDPRRAEAWIFRILRNEINDYFRRAALHAKRSAELPADLAATASRLTSLCPCAVQELAQLRPNYSDALLATEMNGEAIVAYAARKSLTANNATVLVHRARKALRSRIETRCGACAGPGCFNCSCTA